MNVAICVFLGEFLQTTKERKYLTHKHGKAQFNQSGGGAVPLCRELGVRAT